MPESESKILGGRRRWQIVGVGEQRSSQGAVADCENR